MNLTAAFRRFSSTIPLFIAMVTIVPSLANTWQFETERESPWRFANIIVRAEQTVTITAQSSGIVSSVPVEINASVAAGDTIAELDDTDAVLALEQANGEHERAEAIIERAKAVLAGAKSAAQHRRDDLERYRKVGDSVSDSERRSLQESLEQAEIEHIVTYNDYLQALSAEKISRAQVQSAQRAVERMHVSSPIDGGVNRLLIDIGERIEVGQEIAEVRSLSKVLADLYLPESELELGALIGRRVKVEFEASGTAKTTYGVIVSHDSEVNANGLVRIHVAIDNRREGTRWLIFHGKSVTVEILNQE